MCEVRAYKLLENFIVNLQKSNRQRLTAKIG